MPVTKRTCAIFVSCCHLRQIVFPMWKPRMPKHQWDSGLSCQVATGMDIFWEQVAQIKNRCEHLQTVSEKKRHFLSNSAQQQTIFTTLPHQWLPHIIQWQQEEGYDDWLWSLARGRPHSPVDNLVISPVFPLSLGELIGGPLPKHPIKLQEVHRIERSTLMDRAPHIYHSIIKIQDANHIPRSFLTRSHNIAYVISYCFWRYFTSNRPNLLIVDGSYVRTLPAVDNRGYIHVLCVTEIWPNILHYGQ